MAPQYPKFPSAPHPQASVQEVQKFFRDYFLATNDTLNVQDAQAKAAKLRINGTGIYLMPSDGFEDAFGAEGRGIYEIIMNSPYSYTGGYWSYLKSFSKALVTLGAGTGVFQYTKEPKDSSYAVTWICAIIVCILVILHHLASTQRFVKSRFWPQRLKVRSTIASAYTRFVPFG